MVNSAEVSDTFENTEGLEVIDTTFCSGNFIEKIFELDFLDTTTSRPTSHIELGRVFKMGDK